jgi:hypothetical protein
VLTEGEGFSPVLTEQLTEVVMWLLTEPFVCKLLKAPGHGYLTHFAMSHERGRILSIGSDIASFGDMSYRRGSVPLPIRVLPPRGRVEVPGSSGRGLVFRCMGSGGTRGIRCGFFSCQGA